MKKVLSILAVLALCSSVFAPYASAAETEEVTYGKVTGRTVLAGIASFLIWPGIGQAVNDNESDKVITHAVLGITQIFRFWSGWDALVDRRGGYWKDRI